MAIGIDEVGRGSWAGPLLVVAAREVKKLPLGLKDSKKLTKQRRQKLYELLLLGCEFGEGWVAPGEIDRLGLTAAMKLGTDRALSALEADVKETIIIDGNYNFCDNTFIKASAVVKADDLFPIVSAASIYAKVVRDTYMAELPLRYRKYNFGEHVGYGTKEHLRSLERYGVSDIHRRSYAPIKALL